MATHSSIIAWRIPWTEDPSRIQSIGSHKVGHNGSNLACTHEYIYIHTHTHNTHTQTYTMQYYAAIKKNENLPFAATWIDLEDIMPGEMSDRERQIL